MGLLDGKVVIVTGAGPGMNSKVAIQAAQEGATVVVAARSAEFIAQLAQTIRSDGGDALAVTTDVAKPQDCANLVERAVDAYGRVDGLVNGAYAAAPIVPFDEADLADWERAMQVTLFGALRVIQGVLPIMKRNGGGSIVNVGTMETRKPIAHHGAYVAGKSALQGATRALAVEFGPFAIRVNALLPGWMWGATVETFLNQHAQESGASLETLKGGIAANIPLGVIPPDGECARSAIMLLSDYASQVTGASLDVNGGEYMAPS